MKKIVLIILLSMFALNLLAQKPSKTDTNVGNATIVHADEVSAAAKMDDGHAVADSVLRVVTRSKVKGKTPPDAIVHDVVTEVYTLLKERVF